jgi:hypothetical protein
MIRPSLPKRKRLQTPHDRFFKAMFGKTAVISSFVNTYLFPNSNLDIDYNLSCAIKNDTVDGFLNDFGLILSTDYSIKQDRCSSIFSLSIKAVPIKEQ